MAWETVQLCEPCCLQRFGVGLHHRRQRLAEEDHRLLPDPHGILPGNPFRLLPLMSSGCQKAPSPSSHVSGDTQSPCLPSNPPFPRSC